MFAIDADPGVVEFMLVMATALAVLCVIFVQFNRIVI
jgi:hypothetical protein